MPLEPMVESAFGLGHHVRLYPEYLDVNGKAYKLTRLKSVRPQYHHLFGVPSARVELCFQEKKIVLRGMPDVEVAERLVAYLHRWLRLHTGNDVCVVDARTERRCSQPRHPRPSSPGASFPQPALEPTPLDAEVSLDNDISPIRRCSVAEPGEIPRWARRYQEQRERRQRRFLLERMRHTYGFDISQVLTQLESEHLPVVEIPMPLLPGEEAHYITDAMLCGQERPSMSGKRYMPRDHGKLVLTSERLIYFGRKNQIVLAYAQVLHISRVYEAIAFTAEHWPRPEIFAVRHPVECALFLERILAHWQHRQEEQQQDRLLNLTPSLISRLNLGQLPDAGIVENLRQKQMVSRLKAQFQPSNNGNTKGRNCVD
ncbi:hypothetical protein [Ktedonobacter robiniae]|uniref:Uncharacterized protein n=1 Tax=Ktedonobacter robiniae TaxID=2778365 RepID=A0ABQ3UN40_9CHLR|nr:hypothetical protein [Ktedonobacter robiniae]GHO54140.1 hypothetical protein KSB_26150 [Ktedonobacter robiniae]